MPDGASFEGSHDVVVAHDGLVTIEAKSGWRAQRRSKVDSPLTWPADRTTVTFARTDGSGRWLATFASEGRSAVLAVSAGSLDDLTAFADTQLGGCTNTVADAEADRVERRRL